MSRLLSKDVSVHPNGYDERAEGLTLNIIERLDNFRVEFVVKDGQVVGIIRLSDNGERQPSPPQTRTFPPARRSEKGLVY
jgi:hypothetical protein